MNVRYVLFSEQSES